MAARRPIVAGDDTAITDVIPRNEAFFYVPGDAADCAEKIMGAISGKPEITEMTDRAYATVQSHTLPERARRILSFIRDRLAHPHR
jgi:hypothetical protein